MAGVSKIAVEMTVLDFIQTRYSELGFPENPIELFEQSATLRTKIATRRIVTTAAAAIGLVLGLLGIGGLIENVSSWSFDAFTWVVGIGLVGLAWWLLVFSFQSERKVRVRPAGEQFAIPHSAQFERVFKPVLADQVQLAWIAMSGGSIGFTPTTNKPIDRYVARSAFDDRWLPADLLYLPSSIDRTHNEETPELIVIFWHLLWPASRRGLGRNIIFGTSLLTLSPRCLMKLPAFIRMNGSSG
jgi:hypothetical protein